jgi:hypothetical protein
LTKRDKNIHWRKYSWLNIWSVENWLSTYRKLKLDPVSQYKNYSGNGGGIKENDRGGKFNYDVV